MPAELSIFFTYIIGILIFVTCGLFSHPYNITLFILPKDTLAMEGIETHPGPTKTCVLDDPDAFAFDEEPHDH